MPSQTNCLRYWDRSSQIRLDDAIALWCNVDPAELGPPGLRHAVYEREARGPGDRSA